MHVHAPRTRHQALRPVTPGVQGGPWERRAVRNILRSSCIQPKLRLGATNDPAEAEADRVADQVMRMPEPAARVPSPAVSASAGTGPVRRLCAECESELHGDSGEDRVMRREEEEEIHLKRSPETVQRLCPHCAAERDGAGEEPVRRQAEDEEDLVQTKEAPGGTTELSPASESLISGLGGGGVPLPASERAFFEPRFGRDLSGVRIHTGERAEEASRAIGARAFTLGHDIAFAGGEYGAGSAEGRRLMAHELAHVVQQENGGGAAIRRLADETGSGRTAPATAASPRTGRVTARGSTPRLRIHVLGAERAAGSERRDRRLVDAVERTAKRESASELILARSFVDMLSQLETRTGRGNCLASVTVWNHAAPKSGKQLIGVSNVYDPETGRFEEQVDAFGVAPLVGQDAAFDRGHVARLRRLFCCDGEMIWRGCANVSFVAPEGERPELAAGLAGETTDRERRRLERRYERFSTIYHDRGEAEARGATVLAGRDNRVGAQLWANALCVPVTGTNDLLYPDAEAEPAFTIGFGGGTVRIEPQIPCSCDADTGRVAGDIPDIQSLRDQLEEPCSAAALDMLHAAVSAAEQRLTAALAAVTNLVGIAPEDSLSEDGRHTESALQGAFGFNVDHSLLPLMGVSRARTRAEHAVGQGRLARVVTMLSDALTQIRRYLGAPSCPIPARTASNPCFSCKLDQFPDCESGAAAFLSPISGGFAAAVSVCPTFFLRARRAGGSRQRRSGLIFHEFTHFVSSTDIVDGVHYYGCPVVERPLVGKVVAIDPRWFEFPQDLALYVECLTRRGTNVARTQLSPEELLTVADAYRCFLDLFDGGGRYSPPPEVIIRECLEEEDRSRLKK